MTTSYQAPLGASFAFEMCLRTLDEQLRRIESLDTKAGILMAVDGVLAGLLFAPGSLLAPAPRSFAILIVCLVTLSFLLGLSGFSTRRYRTAPQTGAVIRMMSAPEAWLRWRFLGNLEEAIDSNDNKLRWKARFLSLALAGLFAAIAIVGGYLVYAFP